MSSRDKGQTTPHQPLLSSLVVRPTESSGAGGGGAGGAAGSDYEPGEVRRDPPPYSRSDRYDVHGKILRFFSIFRFYFSCSFPSWINYGILTLDFTCSCLCPGSERIFGTP